MLTCDTSFLFSLYVHDKSSMRAQRHLQKRGESLKVTAFLDYEFHSALFVAEQIGTIPKGAAEETIALYSLDRRESILEMAALNLQESLDRAKALTRKHSVTRAYRPFDVLHVACALVLGANLFLTLDRVQKKLALAEGLKSPW